jgi:hypothetical protein
MLTDETLEALLAAPRAVVVVTETDHANSARYLAEIRALLGRGAFAGVTIGVLDRATAEGGRYWQEVPWLAALRLFPFTLVYARGKPVEGFAAVQADVLRARLAALEAAGVHGANATTGASDGEWWSLPLGSRRPAA